ncbi:hypothetical protein ACE1SV_62680 [Streptomyces sp. E-15]
MAAVGVHGCGAPLMAISLTGPARAFRSFARAAPGSPERRVADAMRAHPEYVAGTRRHHTWLMREVPGVLSKVGAEAVQAVALPDGRALALKVDDGAARSLGPVLARALRLLGVTAPVVERIGRTPVLGGGRAVGEVRAVFRPAPRSPGADARSGRCGPREVGGFRCGRHLLTPVWDSVP